MMLLDPRWVKAMQEEFNVLQHNTTWELVPFSPNMNLVGCKWVLRVKYNPDGLVLKFNARLVGKGFYQNPGIGYTETSSLVVKAPTIHNLLSLAVNFGRDIQ